MASDLPDPKRFRVSSQVRSTGPGNVRLDVGVEHIDTGLLGGDYVVGRYTAEQLEQKKAELANQIAEDLDAVAQGAAVTMTKYVATKRRQKHRH